MRRGPFPTQRNAPRLGAFLIAKIREAEKPLTVLSALLAPFFAAIVAIIATDNFHMPFGFVAGAKGQRANPNELVTFRDAFHNVAMAVLAMNDVVFPSHRRGSERNKSAKRKNNSNHWKSSIWVHFTYSPIKGEQVAD